MVKRTSIEFAGVRSQQRYQTTSAKGNPVALNVRPPVGRLVRSNEGSATPKELRGEHTPLTPRGLMTHHPKVLRSLFAAILVQPDIMGHLGFRTREEAGEKREGINDCLCYLEKLMERVRGIGPPTRSLGSYYQTLILRIFARFVRVTPCFLDLHSLRQSPQLHRSVSFGTINLHRTLPSSQPRSPCHVAHASVCRRKEGLGPRFP
jgi:hypothetical protein